MFQPAPGKPYVEPVITINGQKLKATDKFPYLGSVMSDSATIDDEFNPRVARASSSFGRLREKLQSFHMRCLRQILHVK